MTFNRPPTPLLPTPSQFSGSFIDHSLLKLHPFEWTVDDVVYWARHIEYFSLKLISCLESENIDGHVLMQMTEDDVRFLRYRLSYNLTLNDIKKLWLAINNLKKKFIPPLVDTIYTQTLLESATRIGRHHHQHHHRPYSLTDIESSVGDELTDYIASSNVIDPEYFKLLVSFLYIMSVSWITAIVMVIVHDRVPDSERYPPLPDIVLDNIPYMPGAFALCEFTGTILFIMWMIVIIFHKFRIILLRRFFALLGTVFLLRCVTMLITSLSVPSSHLKCSRSDYLTAAIPLGRKKIFEQQLSRAYIIWSSLGMSIHGIHSCGDYMFSGHTVTLTLLNFFITEYTPHSLYFLHTITWLFNMFGVFLILAAHEHYSIDVFIAFYISSRLFLYYHTLANNQALFALDSKRIRIWFPLFSYFESSVNGIVPNEYDTVQDLIDNFVDGLISTKDIFMMTARRFYVTQTINQNLNPQNFYNAFIRPNNNKNNNNDGRFKDVSTSTDMLMVYQQPQQKQQQPLGQMELPICTCGLDTPSPSSLSRSSPR